MLDIIQNDLFSHFLASLVEPLAAYVFTATTPDERDDWISAVKEHVAVLKPPDVMPAAPAAEVKAEAATAGSPAPAAAAAAPPAAGDFSDPIEIGYWKIRGLAAPLRQMCVYVVPSPECWTLRQIHTHMLTQSLTHSLTHIHSLTLSFFSHTRTLSISLAHSSSLELFLA